MRNLGYYTQPNQTTPEFDPGIDIPCPCCGITLGRETPLRTISLRRMADPVSYFYRTHRACHERLTPPELEALDRRMLAQTTS